MAFSLEHSLLLLSALLWLGVQHVRSCDQMAIQQCANSNGLQTQQGITPEKCDALSRAIDCVHKEINKCSPQMREAMAMVSQALDKMKKSCDDPNSHSQININVHHNGQNVQTGSQGNPTQTNYDSNCEQTGLQTCAQELQSQASDAGEKVNTADCKLLPKARRCLEDFKKKCPNPFFHDLIQVNLDMVDQMTDKCGACQIQHGVISLLVVAIATMFGQWF